jgi:hypothetical protein
MTEGIYYWEIKLDNRNEKEITVGVTINGEIDVEKDFCGSEYGFGYSGRKEIIHKGKNFRYGKNFKNSEIIGVSLDMNRGVLEYSVNGKYVGIGFTN